jgi:microcystin-dependent protein
LLATSTSANVAGASEIYASAQPNSTLASNAISQAGGGQPVDIRSPYLTLNWIIALTGIYPSRA